MEINEKIRFLTDSASDIPPEIEAELGIVVIPFPVSIDGKDYLSRVDFDNEGFYRLLAEAKALPTHSQITVYQFTEYYEQAWNDGCTDLIVTSINASGSGTYNSACLAAKLFREAHPEAEAFHIHNLDGASYTCAYGYPVIEGARMARRGEPVDKILAFMRDWLAHSVIYFVPWSLKYAAKSGRIPSAAAFVGELVGLKPVMRIYDHQIVTNDKVRGEKKVFPTVARKMASEIRKGAPYVVIYGDHVEEAEAMERAMVQELGYPPAGRCQIGAVIAINAGPRVAGVMSVEG